MDRSRSRQRLSPDAGMLRRLEELGHDIEEAVIGMGPGEWQDAHRELRPGWQPPVNLDAETSNKRARGLTAARAEIGRLTGANT